MSSHSFRYRIAGLRVRSEFPLPAVAASDDGADITIGHGRVSTDMPDAIERGSLWAYSHREWYIEPRPGLRLAARDGRELVVDGAGQTPVHDILAGICGLAFGVLAIQRGLLVLHGNAVLGPDGRAAIFLGPSGAGKSTISAVLRRRGAVPLADEVSVLVVADGRARIATCFPGARISLEAADYLGWDRSHTLPSLAGGSHEVRLPVPTDASPDEYEVGSVHVIGPRVNGPGAMQRLRGLEALARVRGLSYQPAFCQRLGQSAADFANIAVLARTAPVIELSPPNGLAELDAFCGRLEAFRTGAA